MSENEVLFVRSSKKNHRSSEGDSSTNDDIWDDTILIEAYDKAVQLAQQNFLKKKQSMDNGIGSKVKMKLNEGQKWKVGDKCRCQYSKDLNYYEADIIDIIDSSGMCIVKYVGYENEEKISLKKLKPSEGEEARSLQFQQAQYDNESQNSLEVESDSHSNSGSKSHSNQKKPFFKKKDTKSKSRADFGKNSNIFPPLNFPFPQASNVVMPPPPPPHMFRNLSEDENETEAMSAMLISWYMSGYHTGYYQGLKMAKKE